MYEENFFTIVLTVQFKIKNKFLIYINYVCIDQWILNTKQIEKIIFASMYYFLIHI